MQNMILRFKPRRARWLPDLDAIRFMGRTDETVVEFMVTRASLGALLPEYRQDIDAYGAVTLFHRLELSIHEAAQREFNARGPGSEPIWLSTIDLKARPLARRRSAQ
jgi:hypothetical protein